MIFTSIPQLDEMETKLEEAKLAEDRLCAEMCSLGLERNPAHSPSQWEHNPEAFVNLVNTFTRRRALVGDR